MKKILSLAVLLMTALVGFTACSDDESDDVKSLSKTTFTTTMHVSDPIKSGDLTYTISFNDDAQCVMRVESRNMKLLNIDKTYSDDTYYGGTYTKDGNTITFNVNCITTEAGEHSVSVIDHPETHTFTYNPDTKVLTIDGGLQLNSTKFAHLECKKYAPSNAIAAVKLEDLVGFWHTEMYRVGDNQYAAIGLAVNPDGNAILAGGVTEGYNGKALKSFSAEGPLTIDGKKLIIDGWTVTFDGIGNYELNHVKVYDPNGKLYLSFSYLIG